MSLLSRPGLVSSDGQKYCHPITDSKQPRGQGQPLRKGFLWIREAGIPLIFNCLNPQKRLAILKAFQQSKPDGLPTGEWHSKHFARFGANPSRNARSCAISNESARKCPQISGTLGVLLYH